MYINSTILWYINDKNVEYLIKFIAQKLLSRYKSMIKILGTQNVFSISIGAVSKKENKKKQKLLFKK